MCWTAQIKREAALRRHDPLVADLLALLLQRQAQRDRIDTTPPRVTYCSECGAPCANIRHGRHRYTCGARCRKRRSRRLTRLARQAAGM